MTAVRFVTHFTAVSHKRHRTLHRHPVAHTTVLVTADKIKATYFGYSQVRDGSPYNTHSLNQIAL